MQIIIIIISGLVAVVGGLSTLLKWKEIKKTEKFLAIGGIVLALLIFVNNISTYSRENRKLKIEAKTGQFKPEPCKNINFRFLGTESILTTSENQTDISTFSTELNKLIRIKKIDNKLYVSVNIRDLNGQIIANIVDNKWSVYDDRYLFNYDKKGIEIMTPIDEKIIFQFEFKDSSACFAGLFVDEKGKGFFVKPYNDGGLLIQNNLINQLGVLNPIFKYPKSEFVNKRITKQ